MSTVTPPLALEAQHRLAVAEGLLLSLGSGPRSLEAARKFLGDENLSIDEARGALEHVIVEAALVCKTCAGKLDGHGACAKCKASSATGAKIPVTGHEPATEIPYLASGGLGLLHARPGDEPGPVGDLPKDLDKGRRKKRKRKARAEAISDLLHESTAATVAAVLGGVELPAPTPPPNLRDGTPDEECANCIFFNKGTCTSYGHFPVTRVQVCDAWSTLLPRDFDHGSQVFKDRMLTESRLSVVLEEIASDAYPGLDRSPKENWVDKTGGLPRYIERIAKHIHYEHGKDIGRSIQIAVGVVQRWCKGGGASERGGVKGGSGVSGATKAKACAAVAEWDAKRAASKAQTAAKKVAESTELVEAHGFWALSIGGAVSLIEAAEWEDARDGKAGFKPPSLAYCEQITSQVEEAYSDWGRWVGGFSPEAMEAIVEGRLELDGATCDIDESLLGKFKASLHPRDRRTGEFADVLGGLRKKRPRTAKLLDQIAGEKKYQVSSVFLDGNEGSEGKPFRNMGRALAHRDRVRKELDSKGYGRTNSLVRVTDSDDPERGDLDWDDARSLEQLFFHDNSRGKREQSTGDATAHDDFKIDHAIGEVIGKFPNVSDWNLEGPKETTAYGKHWVVHVKLADGAEHSIRVGADGKVDYVKPAKATKTVEPFHHGNGMQVGEKITFGQPKTASDLMSLDQLEPTGMQEEPYHMPDGQFFLGTDGVLYEKLEHGSHLLTSKKGSPLAGVRIKNHHTGTEKIAPAFAVKHPYDLYQPKGSGPVASAKPAKSQDELMGELMSSVKGGEVDLNGKHVVITGSIPGMSRTTAQAALAVHGAIPQSSVTNQTDYLITGNGVGKVKTDAAEKKGVKVIPHTAIPHLVVEGATFEEETLLSGTALRLQETLAELEAASDGASIARLRARRDVLAGQLARQEER